MKVNAVHRAIDAAQVWFTRSRKKIGPSRGDRQPADIDHLSQLIREHRQEQRATRFPAACRREGTTDKTAIKISVIAWDVGHNALGRAHLLADVLRNQYRVEVIGANFSRYGDRIWEPLRTGSRVPIRSFPGENFPGHFQRMNTIAKQIDGDVIYVSKPRLPSMELAILAKLYRNRPILLDIDDYEPGFFKNRDPLSLSGVKAKSRTRDFFRPYGETWTRFSESLIPMFDRTTVSNEELRKKFGGLVVPHIRDELDFDTTDRPRDALRKALHFSPEERVIVFLGTPLVHKGLARLADALRKLKHSDYKLLIIGSPVNKKAHRFFRRCNPEQIILIPNVPFADLSSYLSIGDLICLVQNEDDAISHYQMPAKFTDALSMGIPILASNVPPLENVAREKLVELLNDVPLERRIDHILSNYETYKHAAMRNRSVFLQRYSYAANLPKLKNMIDSSMNNPTPIPDVYRELVSYHHRVFSHIA